LRSEGFRLCGWACLALYLSVACGGSAIAADPDRLLFVRPEDQRTVLFGQVDAGRSLFVTAGSKQTLTGPLDRSGFVIMETTGFGLTRETLWRDGVDLPATRVTTQTSVTVGHQWSLNRLFLAGFIGPEILHEQLTVAGRACRFSEPRYGAKAQFELWANPTADTLLTATIVGTSSNLSLSARGSAGMRIGAGLFAGPEIAVYTKGNYQETKLGAHLTGWSLGIVQGRISGGWMTTEEKRSGTPYISVGAWIRM
jgi:hypothetical protein